MRKQADYIPPLWGVLTTVMFGLLLMLPALDMLWAGIPSRSWPTTTAIVTANPIEEHTSTSHEGHTTTRYIVRLDYAFDFEGRRRTSSFYDVGGSRSFLARVDAEAFAAAHPVGGELQVYVNEAVPERSVVDPDDRGQMTYFLASGGAVLAFGLLLFVTRVVRKRRLLADAAPETAAAVS